MSDLACLLIRTSIPCADSRLLRHVTLVFNLRKTRPLDDSVLSYLTVTLALVKRKEAIPSASSQFLDKKAAWGPQAAHQSRS